MKFIHTADWHLGNKMHEVDRTEETAAFLKWLKEEIGREEAETLVVAGDIFDVVNPPVDARAQFYSFMASLRDTCCRNVIVIGGNHDSGQLLDAPKEVFSALNIHVVGSIDGRTAEDMVFELYDGDGNVNGICASVPFAREAQLRVFLEEEAPDRQFFDMAYKGLYNSVLEAAEKLRDDRDIPMIATGHLYAANLEGRPDSSESDKYDDGVRAIDVVGHLGSVHSETFPDDFSYVALGHIHYSGMVNKTPRIMYSGSPFVMGFDEAAIPRHILSVNIDGRGSAPITAKIDIPKTVEYKRLTGNSKELKEELEKPFRNDIKVYLEIAYKKELNIDIRDTLEDSIKKLPENVEIINWKPLSDNERRKIGYTESGLDIDGLKEMDFDEMFRTFIISEIPAEPEEGESEEEAKERVLDMFLECFKEAQKELEDNSDEDN